MKYLLVMAVVLVAFWIWRNNRRDEAAERAATPRPKRPATLDKPVPMVACRTCGTHLPQTEALTGRQGVYCSAEHRERIEGRAA